jgi:hypothetical protein
MASASLTHPGSDPKVAQKPPDTKVSGPSFYPMASLSMKLNVGGSFLQTKSRL